MAKSIGMRRLEYTLSGIVDPDEITAGSLAIDVLHSRRPLGEITKGNGMYEATVSTVAEAIEAVTTFVFLTRRLSRFVGITH
jgi:hypothetical protein